jgi:hypothetical protein
MSIWPAEAEAAPEAGGEEMAADGTPTELVAAGRGLAELAAEAGREAAGRAAERAGLLDAPHAPTASALITTTARTTADRDEIRAALSGLMRCFIAQPFSGGRY